MNRTSSASLLQFLQRESSACEAERTSEPDAAVALAEPELRVPVELDGALWSAVVEKIAERSIALIVDREAVGTLDDTVEGAIHYQPDNAAMQRARGQVTTSDLLNGRRVRLNFELM